MNLSTRCAWTVPAVFIAMFAATNALAADAAPSPVAALNAIDVASGGLCVFAGGSDAPPAVALAKTGRWLVHLLAIDQPAVDSARKALHNAQVYGLASADLLPVDGKLPYTENLINAIFVSADAQSRITPAEIVRVLEPRGLLFLPGQMSPRQYLAAGMELPAPAAAANGWTCLRKPFPPEMDQWTHSRHAADGNPVSSDSAAGVPRRVRWIAGPQRELSNFVTAGGRAYFMGVLTRDAFNGLRLWEQKLTPSPARGGFGQTVGDAVQPVASADLLLVYSDECVRSLQPSTGKLIREYPQAGVPIQLMLDGDRIVSINKDAISIVSLKSAQLLWRQSPVKVRDAVTGDSQVFYLDAQQAEPALVCRNLADGAIRWQQQKAAWLAQTRRLVYHQGLLACEVSTLNDNKPGNILHMLSAADGNQLWERQYVPGASHKKQARAMFAGDLVWILQAKTTLGLDPRTGDVRHSYPAGNTHCFPPVATIRYLIAGEMDLTDLSTGQLVANQITKQACSRDAGVVPANGLLYTFPKHCICWPMLRDYAALAPQRSQPLPACNATAFVPDRGSASPPAPDAAPDPASQWPCYRHDAIRSGATATPIPANLSVQWTASLGDWPNSTIADDWRGNYFIRGPVGPPVIAGDCVYVTRPDAHQVVAIDARTGSIRWTFTANGRVDTAPTFHRGLLLFGSKSGFVYALRADNGAMLWRLRAAPVDERIVAYGQIESPWPVPGSVLIDGDTAYFAAGRQPLADGGVLVFAVDPMSGQVKWVQRLDRVPQTDFYGSSGLEFDNFDLLLSEGSNVAMSRWLFDKSTGKISCRAKSGFAELSDGGGAVLFPRGTWSYAPRNESEQCKERPFVRPLMVFHHNAIFGCTADRRAVYRREFHLDTGEKFNTDWFAGWGTYSAARKGGDLWQTQRLAHGSAWNAAPFGPAAAPASGAAPQTVHAMILCGDRLCIAGTQGKICVIDANTGAALSQTEAAIPAWDSLAAAGGCLYLTTQDGRVMCLGAR